MIKGIVYYNVTGLLFNLSHFLVVSINALIAREKRPVSPLAVIFVGYLLAPIMYLQNLVWTFSGIKSSYNSSYLYVESFPKFFSRFIIYGLQTSQQ